VTTIEGDTGTKPAVFTVSLSNPYDQEVTVDYSTLTGHTTDIISASGTVHFAPGVTQQTITIQVVGDRIVEDLEAFNVVLANPTPNASFDDGWGYGTILDNDVYPVMVVSDVTRAEGKSGTTPFQFTISLSTPSGGDVSVKYATAAGTATSSGGQKDYQAVSGTIVFAAGQLSRTVTVAVTGDTRVEGDETFFLNLSSVANATLADGQGVATILNDETRGKKWVGAATGGSWSTAANWSPSGVPVASSLVTIAGASVTVSANTAVAELSLTGGATLTVAPSGSSVLRTPGLFVDSPSKLNLNDNALIVDYTGNTAAMESIVALLAAGRAGGTSPAGIYSPAANASSGTYTLGAVEASDVLGLSGAQTALFAGQSVDATSVLVKQTFSGDASLDGRVDFGDLVRLAQSYNTSGGTWARGDFTGDGNVDFNDLVVLAQNYNKSLPGGAPALAAGQSFQEALAAAFASPASKPIPVQKHKPASAARPAAPTAPFGLFSTKPIKRHRGVPELWM
jgi:urease beta subunit